ncbi:MAG TPA: membrane dipeptidase [Phycisphaerae bacterium]|nr:membrane dipeptidase [Phycisphaerae bacterium]
MHWFDGHLDLTYLALHGRDLARTVAACGGTLQPASVTFPSLRAAGVCEAYSTLFVRRKTNAVAGGFCFGTEAEAFASAWRQIEMHRAWKDEGHLHVKVADGDSSPGERGNGKLKIRLAIEGAACIRTPEDADVFAGAGVRMVSLAWAEGSKWSGGDQTGGDLTAAGRALIPRLDALGIIHDVSHLAEPAFWSLLETARGTVVASHSNCRALLAGHKSPERHLSDAQIRALAARPGARIGITLFNRFLVPPDELARRRPTSADVIRHITHVEQIAGTRAILALGSDFDSGFGTDLLPADLQGPQDLIHLAHALSDAGWSDQEIARFAGNWER